MVWFLLVMLSCITKHDFLYAGYPVNQKVEVFAIGKPHQKSSWSIEPNIRICSDTKVTVFRVSQAVRYWERLGYKFGSIFTDNSSFCMNARFGEILITLPESGFGGHHMASTTTYTRVDSDAIVKAKISILPKYARKERVLEHEIGHALGWAHHSQKYHMMHPNWFLGGDESRGLKKQLK